MRTDSEQNKITPTAAETLCATLARADDHDRWLTALLARPGARASLHVLTAFHGELAKIRDLVSEPMLGRIRLQWWRETLDALSTTTPRDHPVAEALAPLIADGRISTVRLMSLIDAREGDLDGQGFATMSDFNAYFDTTAGTHNQLALDILGIPAADHEPAHIAALHIGRAHGIAGHLRAAAVNAARGRVTLPRELLAEHGVDPDSLLAGRPGPGLARVARALCLDARASLAMARAEAPSVPRAALAVLALARFAERYLTRMEGAGFDLFAGRIEPMPLAGPLHILKTMISGRY